MIQQQRTTNNEQHTNDSDVVVSVKNVSKKFCKNLKRSMAYGIAELSKNLMGIKSDPTELRKDEFWAVDDISFDLRKGEVLGLVGPNGSGKSTLLRMLAGIFPPDKGEIEITGRVGALIALGAGFHPHMTGRENIYLNGTILGLNRKELEAKFDDIIDFAEIGEFVNAPVSTYSSGMRVRLGFAIASQLDPDIFLIDEVLAVGDVGFRSKCFNAIDKISKNAAVIYVSHQMPQVARICSDLIMLNKGKTIYQGKDIPKGIESYYLQFVSTSSSISGSGRAKIQDIKLSSNRRLNSAEKYFKLNYLDDFIIELAFILDPAIYDAIVTIVFFDKEMRGAAQCYSSNCNFPIINSGKQMRAKVKLKKLQLNPGIYDLSIAIVDGRRGETLINYHGAKKIQVIGPFMGFAPVQFQGEWQNV